MEEGEAESLSVSAGSGRHQLVVVTLSSASHLPAPAPSYQLVVRGELQGVTLLTDPVTVTSTTADLQEQQLVWEASLAQLRQFRSRKVLLRLELWLQEQLLGHFVMDLRTAQPVTEPQDDTKIVFKSHKLLGSQVTVEAGLSLEESENISVDLTEDTEEVQVISHAEDASPLHPTLVEEDEEGEGGYFLIGDRAEATESFSISLSLVRAEHLSLVLDESTVLPDPFYWQYNILGVDISSEQFPSLSSSKELFESEKATATIRSSRASLAQYLSGSNIRLKLCSGAVVVAAAELPLVSLLQPGQEKVTSEVRLELVSSHNLAVRRDSEGNTPSLVVRLELVTKEDVITSGKLSDSEEMELEEESTPTKLTAAENTSRSPLKPAQLQLKADEIPPTPGLDTTDYLQLYRKTNPPPDRPNHYDLSVDLLSIVIEEEDFNVDDAVLLYKYLALYKDPIKTDTFPLRAGKQTEVPNGYCQFSFYVGKEKMISTFEQHHMKIGLYVANQIICMASINLANVVRSEDVWRERVALLRKDSGKLMGHLQIELNLKTRAGPAVENTKNPSEEKLAPTKDLISKAVMDLEDWKTEQKKKFNENLLSIEAQHLNLLGQEWKERELERERAAQEKMDEMKSLEQELRQELEKIEIERKEINEKNKTLEIEKMTLDTEKSNLKSNKASIIDKLKMQIREKETEISFKNSEIEMLTQRVKRMETEASRNLMRKPSSSSSQERLRSEDMAELSQVSENASVYDNILYF